MSSQCLFVCVASIAWKLLQHVLKGGQVKVNLVSMVLINQCKSDLIGATDFSCGGLEATKHQLHKSCLAVAIFTLKLD
jgi:hypothetical protein